MTKRSRIRTLGVLRLPLLAFLYCVGTSSPASAQQLPPQMPTDDPVAEAPIRLGVVAVDPRVSITNLGVDTNVFNSNVDPERDFTFTISPGTQLFMRTGRGLLTVDADLDFVYFNEFQSERSVNSSAFGQYEFRFNRMRPYVSAATLNTRERPGYEIDARARHYETEFHVGTDLRVASKTTLRLDLRHLDYRFAGDQVFNGQALNEELNRSLDAVELNWRQRLTALTTWVARVTRETERFEFDNFRNSDSLRVSTGFELGRFALIRGAAFVGYRKLSPADGGQLPPFSGVTADVAVSYTAPTQTRATVAVVRDVEYSYEKATPYYLLTSWTVAMTQRLIGRWDVQLLGGRDRLSYQALLADDDRLEFVGRFGGGLGYNLNEAMRVSLDIQSLYRSSVLTEREYGALRAGVSVTYGY